MDRESSQPFLVAFTGIPGTGRSTLADRLAVATGTPAFSSDWLMGALNPLGVLYDLDPPTYRAVYYSLVETLVIRQLRLRLPAITDCVLNEAGSTATSC